jgi:predicted DNA-binding transcriptional regulator AlpA
MSAALAHVRPVPRRGLSRDEAPMYCGISSTLFDRLVADGRMPGPCRIDGRKVWDVRAIDVAFDALPREDARQASSWEDA